MKSLFSRRPGLEKWAAALSLLLVAGAAYLPLAGTMGYYRDDWHVLWAAVEQGTAGIIDQHTLDRPLMGVVYAGIDFLLGHHPLGWQLFAFGVRIAGAWVLLWLLRSLWPNNKSQTLFMTLLFAVYPGFYQQANAHTYQNHLVALLFGLLSIALTVQFVRAKFRGAQVFLAALSIFFSAACYMMFEWMIGLEGLRLALLWFLESSPRPAGFFRRVGGMLRAWLPNLVGVGGYLVWRIVFFKSARSVTNIPALAHRYLADPGGNILRVIAEGFKDLFETLFSAWFTPLYQLIGQLTPVEVIAGMGLALFAAAIALLYLKAFPSRDEGASISSCMSFSAALWIGFFAALTAVLPPILAERHVEFRDGLDRYSLTAMAGVAIALGGLIDRVLLPSRRNTLFIALVAIGVFTQFSGMVYFRTFWDYQRQLWWQLNWRAPDIKEDTALIPLLPSGYRLAEGYEIWAPANLIYRPGVNRVAISGEALNNQTSFYLTEQLNLGRNMRKVEYTVDFKNSLVMAIPAAGSCLHVLDGERPEYSLNDDPLTRISGGYSRIAMIQTETSSRRPPEDIFGAEPPHTWCFYYQKASLARQRGDWQEVVRLGKEAAARGLQPQDIVEWLPFYEGYVHLWQYEEINRIAGILRSDHFFIVGYCQQFQDFVPDPDAPDQSEQFMVENLCGQLDAIQ
ncbi:MAG: hypothetical protein IT308_02050 [Anaerolineaceae bacterium]|nr:hypothetical protein [Anaerolineaceae bacterium]